MCGESSQFTQAVNVPVPSVLMGDGLSCIRTFCPDSQHALYAGNYIHPRPPCSPAAKRHVELRCRWPREYDRLHAMQAEEEKM